MEELSIGQRMAYLNQGKRIDRVPFFTNATLFSGIFAQMGPEEYLCDAEHMYDAQEQTRALFGCHGAPTFCHTNWLAECLGGVNHYERTPWGFRVPRMDPVIRCQADAEAFSTPERLEDIPVLKLRERFIRICQAHGRNMVGLMAGSALEIAAQITDINLLLQWTLRRPELVCHICDGVTQFLLRLIDSDIAQYGAENCMGLFFYPLESRDIMSPKLLDRISWPYIFGMHQALRDRGVRVFQEHLCGSQNGNLPVFRQLGLPPRTCFSLDERTDLAQAAAVLGADYILAGNVSSHLLAAGKPGQVMDACREILAVGKRLEGGFILAPSCDLPPTTPPLNLYAMQRAVLKYGVY